MTEVYCLFIIILFLMLTSHLWHKITPPIVFQHLNAHFWLKTTQYTVAICPHISSLIRKKSQLRLKTDLVDISVSQIYKNLKFFCFLAGAGHSVRYCSSRKGPILRRCLFICDIILLDTYSS